MKRPTPTAPDIVKKDGGFPIIFAPAVFVVFFVVAELGTLGPQV